jgi:ribosomal protein S18 acetylase RimI-like enzyme
MILQFTIRAMEPDDLKAIAGLHEQAFAGFFSARMGPGFLRAYYASVLSYDRSIALVAALSDGQPIGFVTGFQDREAFYIHFRNQRLKLLRSVVGAVLRKPSLAPAVLRNVRRISSMERAADGGDIAELSSVAVLQTGMGIGSRLVTEFCQLMFRRGVKRIVLITDELGNERVRSFYVRLGFVLLSRERRADRVRCV